ncbi:hypothetical protein K8M07_03405 [Schnuerera sp. xch1]|uniref:hypothetical protein n=1 Tax=Schnuerera sp. xch1 TaxID=2874283 RepID=UPI001CBB0B6A|nr:hypothetical protein [Schnuerera sp. xch1]MBZ2174289.1 hypothetical protein [Schnuerera sp. xch1]
MKIFVKKVFDLSDIRYPWLLIISMLIFIFSLYNNKINPNIDIITELLTYGTAIVTAFVWSILNYIDHIKLSVIYRKNNDIETYVNSLVMKKEDKEDLKEYLNDFVKDLESEGKTEEEAIEIAIGQFQVKEFTSLSKNNGIFELPVHYYLIGYIIIFVAAIVIIGIFTNTILRDSFLLKAINFMFNLYSIGFIVVLFLYKLMDIFIKKKMSY